jgi:hypothetical protein
MNMNLRQRSSVAASTTVLALVLTSLGNGPTEGTGTGPMLALWALGIVAGMLAFVAAASVCSEVAQRFDQQSDVESGSTHQARLSSGHGAAPIGQHPPRTEIR